MTIPIVQDMAEMMHRPMRDSDVLQSFAGSQMTQVWTVSINSNVATTGTSLVDATGLKFTLGSGIRYMGQFHIRYQGSNALAGLGLSLNGPATSEAIQAQIRIAGSLISTTLGTLAVYNAITASTGLDVINTDRMAVIEFSVKTSAPGDLIVRFARSGGLSGTATIMAGSCGFLIAVA